MLKIAVFYQLEFAGKLQQVLGFAERSIRNIDELKQFFRLRAGTALGQIRGYR